MLVEKKKETITESAGRQQKKKIGKKPVSSLRKGPCCGLVFLVMAVFVFQKDKRRS